MQASPHYYELLAPNPAWDEFLEVRKAAVVDMRKIKPNGDIKSVLQWSEDEVIKLFVADFRLRIQKRLAPTAGRIRHLFFSAYHFWSNLGPSLEVIFVEEKLTENLTVRGIVFHGDQPTSTKIEFTTGTKVLKQVSERPTDTASCTMDITALAFQVQFPFEEGVPILYSTDAGSSMSCTQFSFSTDRWPEVKIFDDKCCVLQLVCLLQFGYAPRNPQRGQDTKFINHGYMRYTGVSRTQTYHQKEDEDEDEDDGVIQID